MRTQFDEQLAELNNNLIEMGATIENAISSAIKALMEHDKALAKKVMEGDQDVDQMEKEIESNCLKLILHQQPIASDLRMISTALKMITDMERIGDQAADISEISLLLADEVYIKKLEHIPLMAEATVRMVNGSIDAYVNKDLETAHAVIAQDDKVDRLFYQIKSDLIELIHENRENGQQALDLLMIAKYFERIGDHAENIAEWVIFGITGKHKDTQII